MKYQNACLKCGATDFARVSGRPSRRGAGSVVKVGAFGPVVPVTRYICIQCGFVEEWIDDPADLAQVAKKYRMPEQ